MSEVERKYCDKCGYYYMTTCRCPLPAEPLKRSLITELQEEAQFQHRRAMEHAEHTLGRTEHLATEQLLLRAIRTIRILNRNLREYKDA